MKKSTGIIQPVSNDAEFHIVKPYTVEFTIYGTTDLLFHRWSCEDVEEKARAAKGSKAKKTDNLESYVYRDNEGNICLPSEYVRQAIIKAAKYRQDPRSPRKSAQDLFKASIAALEPLASLGTKQWDFLHRCRVTIQRNAITRTRPAFFAGWQATFRFSILQPQYIDESTFLDTLVNAGRLEGVADFRPSYGRFQVVSFRVLTDIDVQVS